MSTRESELRSAKRSLWIHRGAAFAWLVLLVPSLLWWKESLLWVILMSQYANMGTHLSAAEGAEAKLRALQSGG